MTLARFQYFAPKSLDEALGLLREHGEDAVLLSGGTDLLLKIRSGVIQPGAVIALKGIEGLDRITFDRRNGLSIGATALLSEAADHPEVRRRYPALSHAALNTANVQIRNMGTVIGNLCNASPCADNAPTLMALGAEATLAGPEGERRIPLATFFKAPGETAIRPGEIMTSVVVPPPPAGSGTAYRNLSARSRVDMSAVGVGVSVTLGGSKLAAARIVMGSVGPVPLRAKKAEGALIGRRPTAALFQKAGELAAGESRPISDVRATAAYRRQVVGVLVERALKDACSRAGKG